MLGVFDIGGTGYRVAPDNGLGGLGLITQGRTNLSYNQGVKALVDDLIIAGANKKFERICGCIAGKLDPTASKLIFSPNLTDWVDKNLKSDLEKDLGCEVRLENDAAAEGLGEAFYGAGRGFTRIGFVTAGTGIGGAIINIQNSMFNVQSLEPGWTYKIDGQYWEEVAGGRSMEKIYGKKPEQIEDRSIWEKETKKIGEGLNFFIAEWVPEITILGGSLFNKIDIEYLKTMVSGKMVRGQLGQEAGLWGCLKLLNQGQG